MENEIFIILVLYVDDMLVARKTMGEINSLKAHLARKFDKMDLGGEKQISVMEIHRDRKDGKLWLLQQKYVEKILMRFGMYNVDVVQIPLVSHFNITLSVFPSNEK
jgi:hypothetical protein